MNQKDSRNLLPEYAKPHLNSFTASATKGHCTSGTTPTPVCSPGGIPNNDCEGGSSADPGCNPTGNVATGCDEGVVATSDCFNGTSV